MAQSKFKVFLDNVEGQEPKYITLEEAVNEGFVIISGNSLVANSNCCEIIQYEERG